MNLQRLRNFLILKPKPVVLRVTVGDEAQEVKLGKSFVRTAETVLALDPELVECLDKDGKVLRAQRFDGVDARRSDAPALPPGLAADPHALMLTHFADLLHRAYEHSQEIAFTKLVEVFDIMAQRSETIESRLERAEATNRRLLSDQIETELERAEEQVAQGGGGLDAAVMSMLQQRIAAQAGAPAQPNGKARKEPQA